MGPPSTNDIIGLVLVYLLIATVLFLSYRSDREHPQFDSRKLVHIGIGNFVFVWWMFTQSWIMLVFFTVPFALVLFVAMFKGNVISESRLGELSRRGNNTGLFLYAVTITVLVLFFFKDGSLNLVVRDAPHDEHWLAASVAVMAMTYGDGFGSIIGKRFGKHRLLNGKTLEGSAGVFVATTVMSMVVFAMFSRLNGLAFNGVTYLFDTDGLLPWYLTSVIVGLASAVLEAVCKGDYDNFVNPIAIGILLVLLGL